MPHPHNVHETKLLCESSKENKIIWKTSHGFAYYPKLSRGLSNPKYNSNIITIISRFSSACSIAIFVAEKNHFTIHAFCTMKEKKTLMLYFEISSHFLYVTANTFFLTIGDQCASETTHQTHIDARIHQIIDMEDVDVDLRTLNTGVTSKYDPFWEE